MSDLRAMLACLDPGGPDEGPPRWWLNQWRQEADELPASQPGPEPEPEPAETVASLAAYAAHRERGLSPADAAWAAVAEREMEAG